MIIMPTSAGLVTFVGMAILEPWVSSTVVLDRSWRLYACDNIFRLGPETPWKKQGDVWFVRLEGQNSKDQRGHTKKDSCPNARSRKSGGNHGRAGSVVSYAVGCTMDWSRNGRRVIATLECTVIQIPNNFLCTEVR